MDELEKLIKHEGKLGNGKVARIILSVFLIPLPQCAFLLLVGVWGTCDNMHNSWPCKSFGESVEAFVTNLILLNVFTLGLCTALAFFLNMFLLRVAHMLWLNITYTGK